MAMVPLESAAMEKIRATNHLMLAGTLVLAMAAAGRNAMGQMSPSATFAQPTQVSSSQSPLSPSEVPLAPPPLFDFKDSNTKFNLESLMRILRDSRHEGWVLAAYPDPKTSRPLIGAGFSLDLPAREHPQRDLLNAHPFLEPSSADLWQVAGLAPGRLEAILNQYDKRMAAWGKKRFRKEIKTLAPQITDEESTLLLRIAAIQAT